MTSIKDITEGRWAIILKHDIGYASKLLKYLNSARELNVSNRSQFHAPTYYIRLHNGIPVGRNGDTEESAMRILTRDYPLYKQVLFEDINFNDYSVPQELFDF